MDGTEFPLFVFSSEWVDKGADMSREILLIYRNNLFSSVDGVSGLSYRKNSTFNGRSSTFQSQRAFEKVLLRSTSDLRESVISSEI